MATPLKTVHSPCLTNIWSPLPNESREFEKFPPFPFPTYSIPDSNKASKISLKELKKEKLLPKDLYNEIFRNK